MNKIDLTLVSSAILAIRETTQGIRKSLGKEVRRDMKAGRDKKKSLRGIIENKKKKESEELIEAKKPNILTKGVGAVAKVGKSFLQRIFGAAGAFLVGFLVMNIPKIIEEIEKVVEWVKKIGSWIQPLIDKLKNITKVIVDAVEGFIDKIKELVGQKDKDEIEKQLEEGAKVAETLEKDWNADQEKIKKDIEDAKKEGERIVDGLPKSDQEVVAESNERVNQITALQEQRDSGDITQQQYEAEVDKLYQSENIGTTSNSQILGNQIDRNELSPSEFFGTNEFGADDTDLEINTDLEKLDDKINLDSTNENKDLSTTISHNPGLGYNPFGEEGGSTYEDNKEKKKFKVIKGEQHITIEQLEREIAAGETKIQKMKDEGRNERKIAFEEKQVDIKKQELKDLKAGKPPSGFTKYKIIEAIEKEEKNLVSDGGKVVTVPIDIPKNEKKKVTTTVASKGGNGDAEVIVVAANPIKQINHFNRHFT